MTVMMKKQSPIDNVEDIYIRNDVMFHFTLTMSTDEVNRLVDRVVNDGIGDWGIIVHATSIREKVKSEIKYPHYTLPIVVNCIETNEDTIISHDMLMCAISKTLIDFPYALDTVAGYNLDIDRLTNEDIDEIIQVAVFDSMKYGYAWSK